jgi:hypothetical protein
VLISGIEIKLFVLCAVCGINIQYGGTVVSAGRTPSCALHIFILCCTLKQNQQLLYHFARH